MVRAKRSLVWDHFTKNTFVGEHESEIKVQCKYCDGTLHYDGSTSSMMKHLRSQHKNLQLQDVDIENAGPSGSSLSTPKRQKLTDMGITTGRPCNNTRKGQITDKLVSVIIENNLPIHFSESESFREFMKFVEPNYKCPCAETIRNITESKFNNVQNEIRKEMESVRYVAITTDAWTSISNDAFLAVTASYFNKNWELRTPVLATVKLQQRHTAQYLAEEIEHVVTEWNISDKISAIVHDNGANIAHVAEIVNTEYTDVSCAAHTLQLVINKAMGTDKTDSQAPISKLVNAASRLVGHFSHSALATSELKKKQKHFESAKDETGVEEEPLSLIQYCRTRWNSIYHMLERLHKLR